MHRLDAPSNRWRFLHVPAGAAAIYFTVTLLASALAQRVPYVMSLLEYNRAAILHGAFWRLFTGHLVHLGWLHLALNLLGIALLGVIAATQRSNAFAVSRTFVVMLGTSAGLLLFVPELMWYRGASGVLYGLLLWLMLDLGRFWRPGYLVAVALLAKVFYEALFGASLTSGAASLGGEVITAAHTAGVITAAVCWLATRAYHLLGNHS